MDAQIILSYSQQKIASKLLVLETEMLPDGSQRFWLQFGRIKTTPFKVSHIVPKNSGVKTTDLYNLDWLDQVVDALIIKMEELLYAEELKK